MDHEDDVLAPGGAAQGGLIKLFVGQIPKTWEEEEVREILEPFGPIRELTILKDKLTGTHKGCAFVTYVTRAAAVEAQKALHEKKTLPGMNHPMQVKPATNEPRTTPVGKKRLPSSSFSSSSSSSSSSSPSEERRLFVGMLSRDLTEEDVRHMFSQFGHVEDVSILRNAQGTSKGAAFVRMAAKSQALQAITALHQSQTMPGCSAPLVVKIADTDKEKAQRRLHQAMASLGNQFGGMNNLTAFGLGIGTAAYYQQLIQLQQQASQGTPAASNSFGLGTADLALAALNQQTQASQAAVGTGLGNLGSAVLSATAGQQKLASGGLTNDSIMQAYMGMQTPTAIAASHPALVSLSLPPSYLSPTPLSGYTTPTLTSPQTSTPQQYPGGQAHTQYLYQKQREGQQISGPEGCNLFIYHLPNDVQDSDLIQMFQPFGNVISSKVFIDKHTNLSKCFGFVSFDNPLSAQSAIQAMNGFQIGTKRLKVQLKRPKDASKPY